MPVDFFVGLGATSSIVTLAQARSGLSSKIQMLLKRINEGAYNVAILGAGGVGKTSLSLLLSGKKDEILFDYSESQNIEKEKLGRNIIGKFIIGPGQQRRVEKHWSDIQRDIVSGKIKGIINVVTYGYHSAEESQISEITPFEDGMSNEDFCEKYAILKRQREIELLDQVKNFVKISKGKIWMLTIVNKQDLWWNEREEVEKFYKQGNYQQHIQEIETQKGKELFIHEYVSLSVVVNNFIVGNEIIKANAEGYDQRLQTTNIANMLNTFEGLLKN